MADTLFRHGRRRQRISGITQFGVKFRSRRGQHANAFSGDINAFAADEFGLRAAHRMRDDRNRQAQMTKAARDHSGEGRKSNAADSGGGDAEFFECGRVTRGPGGR